MNEMPRSKIILGFATLFFLGALLDFITNGVLKIQWLSIYATVYVGIAATLYNYALTTPWQKNAVKLTITFLIGAGTGHLLFTGQTDTRNYEMMLTANAPITLESPDFADPLLITSTPLQSLIDENKIDLKKIPIVVLVVKNYGCLQSFKIKSIAGIDVTADAEANWVWKPSLRHVSATQSTHYSGVEEENRHLPWCLIHWF
jgi:hypothetical protein